MKTHKTSVSIKYQDFGLRLAELRQAAGLAQQSDLAELVPTTQQTVSRWESGVSRPRDNQIPRIAAALETDANELLRLAGYATAAPVAAFDQPFPIEALTPESFERFCRAFVEALYPEAEVHRAGGTGHRQDGIDIEARFDDRNIFTFQCKRVQEFGPQKVHAAVAKDITPASKKFLLISRVASPKSRDSIHEHAAWDIWDKDDISAKIRRLPKVDQLRLVDTFFKGRRFELLGDSEAGLWETTEEFFAPFENKGALFNHTWKLIGRDETTLALMAALNNPNVRCALLVGGGGAGKTRVLKQVIEQYEKTHRGIAVRFLSRTSEVTKKALEELGSKPVLIIVDDAHDRNDLGLLFQFLASAKNTTRLLLAFRPYGLDRIKAQASTFSLVSPVVAEINLLALLPKDAEQLAAQVLRRHSGPLEVARDIARLTLDCPLATVVGAQIVAKEKMLFDLAKNENSFRATLFGRFENVIAGEIGSKTDVAPIKQLLKILALLQPFHPEDPALLAVIDRIEKIPPHEASRLIKLLANAGILFRRGAQYRLSPDVLADYIIEANCVGVHGGSTGYAELVFSGIEGERIEHLLVNLGKLDWLRSGGDASKSRLLDGIWSMLKPDADSGAAHLRAVTGVAYYQPGRALDFAENLIRERKFLNQLPELLRMAAYNLKYAERACGCLWEIGKSDGQELNQNPSHAIRVLAELCEVAPNKPREYNETIVDFGLSLIGDPEAWTHRFNPLDIVAPILKTEGHTTGGNSRAISFNPYFINEQFVAKLRQKVIDAILALLSNPNPKIAVLAARRIGDAIRYPSGMFGATASLETRDKWTPIFAATLRAVEQTIQTYQLDPLVLYVIAREISWHADYGPNETSELAERIRHALPQTLDFKILCALNDGYGVELRRIASGNHLDEWEKHLDGLVAEILAAYPNAEALRAFIAKTVQHLQENNSEKAGSPHVLCGKLIYASADFARAIVNDACSDTPSPLARFVSLALARLWQLDASEGRAIVERFLASGHENLIAAIGDGYASIDFKTGLYGTAELFTLERLLSSNNPLIAGAGIQALRRLAQADVDAALKLASSANIGSLHRLADDLATLFTWPQHLPFDRLSEDHVQAFLEKLMAVPELEGHWLETFLSLASKAFPKLVAGFFMRRVEHAAQAGEWNYRPCNHGPYGHVPLRFRETAEYGPLLATVVRWMKEADYQGDNKIVFNYRARELFETLFGSFDGEVVQLLDDWSASADKEDMLIIANILHEAPNEFVFSQEPFVLKLLERAKRLGGEALKRVNGGLFSSAVSGIRQGVAGEPFPRDLEMKAAAEKVLRSLSRFSAGYQLYEDIKNFAESGIEQARRDREAFED